jgi:phenylacetate-CoA ligase
LGERLAGGVVFPAWARREHAGYHRFRRDLEQSQFAAPAELEQLQQRRLGKLLEYANVHCPLYRERFRAAGWREGEMPDAAAWRSLPLLTKRDLQQHGSAIESEAFPRAQRQRNQTGGSTGSPLQFQVDRARFATRMASTHRHNAWAGHQPGDWMAVLWGARLDAHAQDGLWDRCRERLLYRTVELNTSSVTLPDWDRFVQAVRRRRPRFLLAYARAAVALAEYLDGCGIGDLRFHAIITSAEVLSPAHRQIIECTLGGRVFNRYGCREVSVIASECAAHSGMHVNAEALLVEVVPDPGLSAPWGRVVVTDLLNFSMPLIRYDIGDVARWSEAPCVCGRGLPMLAEVQGRTTEFLRLPGPRVVSGPALTLVFADLSSVRQVQIVQRPSQEVILKVVPGAGYDAGVRAELRQRLDLYLRGSVPLAIEEVDAIPCLASGKYLFVVQEAAAAEATVLER